VVDGVGWSCRGGGRVEQMHDTKGTTIIITRVLELCPEFEEGGSKGRGGGGGLMGAVSMH